MKLFIRGTILIFFVFIFGGCEVLWDGSNRSSLKRDVYTLIGTSKLKEKEINCHMIGTTRSGVCKSSIAEEEISRVVKSLNLTKVDESTLIDFDYNSWVKEGECGSNTDYQNRYKSKRRGEELRLNSGTRFEYFILFHNPDYDHICIQVSYAYG